jgi:Antibiotic biosynthesis monooxygenase
MIAFNVVRFRVKPGYEDQFVARHRDIGEMMPGMRQWALVKTGDSSYCLVGEWHSMNHIAAARPQMINILDSMRHMLEDLGAGLGVTDPVSGEAVISLKPAAPKQKAKKKAKARAKPKKRGAKKKK